MKSHYLKIAAIIVALSCVVVVSEAATILVSNQNIVSTTTSGTLEEAVPIVMSGTQYYQTGKGDFSITNTSGVPINLGNGALSFNIPTSYSGITSIYGADINQSWVPVTQVSNSQYSISGTLNPGQTLTFTLNIALSGTGLPSDQTLNVVGMINGKTVPTDGQMSISVLPSSSKSSLAPTEVNLIVNGSNLFQPISVPITNFNTPTIIQNLPYGTYTITPQSNGTQDDDWYYYTISPNTVDVENSTPNNITAYYTQGEKPGTNSLTVALGAAPFATQNNVEIPHQITVYVKDSSGNTVAVLPLQFGQTTQIRNILNTNQTYTIYTTPVYNGTQLLQYSGSITMNQDQNLSLVLAPVPNILTNKVDFIAQNLSGSANITLSTPSYNGLTLNFNNIAKGDNYITIPDAIYSGVSLSSSDTSAPIGSLDSSKVSSVPLQYGAADYGTITYHVTFPFVKGVNTGNQGSQDTFALNSNIKQLMMSCYIGGAMLDHLIRENPEYSSIKLNDDYIYGTLFGQLLQECGLNHDGIYSDGWLPNGEIYPLSSDVNDSTAQGGPFQLNDYTTKYTSNNGQEHGLINYVSLQKSLDYSVEDQDDGVQATRHSPDSLDNVYFAPMAAAFFQYNDMLRMAETTADSEDWTQAIKAASANNVSSSSSFIDMILNACYNAGPGQQPTLQYLLLGANLNNNATTPENYQSEIANINNYTLDVDPYNSAIGAPAQGTFVLYPRQIRFYLDEIYNNTPNIVKGEDSSMVFDMPTLETVFENSMGSLGYVNGSGQYQMISKSVSQNAFAAALASNGISIDDALSLSISYQRPIIFAILKDAINNVATSLNIQFNALSNKTLAPITPQPTPGPTPTGSSKETVSIPLTGNQWYISGNGNFSLLNTSTKALAGNQLITISGLNDNENITCSGVTVNGTWCQPTVNGNTISISNSVNAGSTVTFTLGINQNGSGLTNTSQSITANLTNA